MNADREGGGVPRDIDRIIDGVSRRLPDVGVSQISVKYPDVDDDGVWVFYLPGMEAMDIQVESSTGMCPFIIEHNEMKSSSDAWRVTSASEAVKKVSTYLIGLKHR